MRNGATAERSYMMDSWRQEERVLWSGTYAEWKSAQADAVESVAAVERGDEHSYSDAVYAVVEARGIDLMGGMGDWDPTSAEMIQVILDLPEEAVELIRKGA